MPNTTNYNWSTPADTDLVKDGAAAIRTLGSSVDTTVKNLNPETTLGDISYRSATANTNTRLPIGSNGQILGVSAGVPAWINNDQGDITEVQAGTGISVASGTGPIPVVTNTVATAYDAKGDLIVGTGADTFSKLSVGTNGYTLVADSSETTGLKWQAPAGGGKVLQVVQVTTTTPVTSSTNSQVTTGMTASITPASASNKVLVLATTTFQKSNGNASTRIQIQLKRGATQIAIAENICLTGAAEETFEGWGITYLDSPATTSSTTYDITFANAQNVASVSAQPSNSTGSIILLEIGA